MMKSGVRRHAGIKGLAVRKTASPLEQSKVEYNHSNLSQTINRARVASMTAVV